MKLKRGPQNKKKIKTAIKSNQIKKLQKTDPPKVGILILYQISKFSKVKNDTQKQPPKISKNKNSYKSTEIKKYQKTDPKKAPQPSAGAKRRGVECPELLVNR